MTEDQDPDIPDFVTWVRRHEGWCGPLGETASTLDRCLVSAVPARPVGEIRREVLAELAERFAAQVAAFDVAAEEYEFGVEVGFR